MGEQVLIVLNERESHKSKCAESLQDKLSISGILSSRLPINSEFIDVIIERCPPVLVLDYLLGDYSTGLDVASAIMERIEPERRPVIFFLTDEPSISVAVEAIKSGVANYFELDSPTSIAALVQEIKDSIPPAESSPFRTRLKNSLLNSQPYLIDDLVGVSDSFASLKTHLASIAKRRVPLVLICGEKGSGLTTVAKALFSSLSTKTFLSHFSLRSMDEELPGRLGHPSSDNGLSLGRNLSVLIENVEEDTGELLDFLSQNWKKYFPDLPHNHNASTLILNMVGNTEEAARWQKLLPIEIVQLPGLSDRAEDISELTRHFIKEYGILTGEKAPLPDSSVILSLKELEWMESVKQLRAVIFNVLAGGEPNIDRFQHEVKSYNDHFQRRKSAQQCMISPFQAATSLEVANFNYRIAAARTGCSPMRLRKIIQEGR